MYMPIIVKKIPYQCLKLTLGSSAGPGGLKFTGRSAKLLITLIIFKIFLDVCYLCLQVNTWNCNQINITIVFIYRYIVAKTHFLQYILHWPYVLPVVCLEIIHFLFIKPLRTAISIYTHASWYLHVFVLVKAGVSDAVLISLSSDDCFHPRKEYTLSLVGLIRRSQVTDFSLLQQPLQFSYFYFVSTPRVLFHNTYTNLRSSVFIIIYFFASLLLLLTRGKK